MSGRITMLGSDRALATWDTEVAETVAVAERIFDQARRAGRAMFAVGQTAEDAPAQIDRFDPQVAEIIGVKPLVGG